MTAVSSFLLSNLDSFKYARNQFDVQHHSAMAAEDLIRELMGCKDITEYDSSTGTYVFVMEDDSGNDLFIKYIYNQDDKKLSMGKGANASTIVCNEIATSVNVFTILVLDEENHTQNTITGIDAKGIKIDIETEVNNSKIKLSNSMYFRN